MSRNILIIGAGIAGLALARALERRGIAFDIIDRAPSPLTSGAGMFLPGNAMVALRGLGLGEQVADIAWHNRRQTILDAGGGLLHDMEVDSFWEEAGPCLSLTRGSLTRILRSGVETPIRHGIWTNAIAIEGNRARVTFSNGDETVYDLVIGADGFCSATRALLFGYEPPEIYPRTCWRMLVPNSIGLRHWTVMLGHRRALLGVPVEDGLLYLYGDADNMLLPAHLTTHRQDLRDLFGGFAGPLAPVVDAIGPDQRIDKGILGEVTARDWSNDAALLIGDAAHACSPSMAQGASMAFEDALVLGDCLTGAQDLRAGLAEFNRQRLARVRWVQKQCRARDSTRSLPRPLRFAILRLLGDRLYRRSYAPLLVPFDMGSADRVDQRA